MVPAGTPPSARYHHSAVYDPVRKRMIVCGGSGSGGRLGDVWALSLGASPAWTQLAPSGTPPSARELHSAIYDPAGDRMVVFGGNDGAARNDAWELSLSGAPAWSPLAPAATPPAARYAHSAIYDADNARMLMFGGYDGAQNRNDTWALALSGSPAWAALSPAGALPGIRANHVAIADPARHQMVVFGGGGSSDSYSLSLTAAPVWTALSANSAAIYPRYGHSATYDPDADCMLVFGGYNNGLTYLNDLWASSLAGLSAWTQLSPTGTPPTARRDHSTLYDPVRKRLLVFGGFTSAGPSNGVWALSLAGPLVWSQLLPSGTPPAARSAAAAIYDPVRDRMLVFGGVGTGNVSLNDLWSLSLSATPAWTQLAPSGGLPGVRGYAGAIYDPVRDRMLVMGGVNSGPTYLSDVWSLHIPTPAAWTLLAPSGATPPGRSGHITIYDSARDRMVVFAGAGSGGYANDVWAMSLDASPAWSPLTPAGAGPSAPQHPDGIYDSLRDRLVIHAGYSASYAELWAIAWTTWHTVDATAGLHGTISPAGAVQVADGADRTFAMTPNAGYRVADVLVDGGSVGPVDGYTFTNVQAAHAIVASFTQLLGVDGGSSAIAFALSPRRPNPSTHGGFDVDFSLPRPCLVRLDVYDTAGREVVRLVDAFLGAGRHSQRLSAGSLSTGVYWVRVRAEGREISRRLAVIR